jgi:transposase
MDKVTLNGNEQKRVQVLNEVNAGRMTGREAAEMLGLSLRQARRLLASYRQEGVGGLAHGNRGRQPVNRLGRAVTEEIIRLARGEYVDFNDTHFTEELAERHEIDVSVPTVRRLRREAGLGSPRKRRAPRHRRRRERYPQAGMLLQVDGSKHDWLEGRGPWLTLHAAIDDATSEVVGAIFRAEEDATGYALLLHHISQTNGLPLALYADKHRIFQHPKEPTLTEQLEGVEPRTQLGHLLHDLDITLIAAHSPQAKGRVERLFETLQDRLVKDLRRAGAQDVVQANAVLPTFLQRFNRRFSLSPAQPGSAYRPSLSLAEANARIHFTYWRTVANDHTLSLFGHVVALPFLPTRLNLAGRRVALHHRMDGRLAVVYQDRVLGLIQPAHLGPPRLEQFVPAPQHLAGHSPLTATSSVLPHPPEPDVPTPAKPTKPAPDHPWRRAWSSSKPSIRHLPQRLPNDSGSHFPFSLRGVIVAEHQQVHFG